jgi:immunity protein 5 of polymorphic toxin system
MRLGKQVRSSLVLWTTDCAEHILQHFEENYLKDDRARIGTEEVICSE